MTPEKQRFEIAAWLGWTNLEFIGTILIGVRPGENRFMAPAALLSQPANVAVSSLVPSYLTDLNAMHEAEKVLNSEQDCRYEDWLGSFHDENPRSASASRRAEAFLRATGKWEYA